MGKNYFISLLDRLGVPYTQEYAGELFASHPYRYTLFGLRSMLRHYGISAEAVKCSDKEEALESLSDNTPFVAQFLQDLTMVTSVDSGGVEYESYGTPLKMTRESFLMVWSGIALVITDISGAAEPGYRRNLRHHRLRQLERYSAIVLTLLLALCAGVWSGLWRHPWMLAQMVPALCGLWFSTLLMAKTMKIDLSAGDRLCRMIKGHDCHDVLELPASKLFGRYGWSEIGVAYFLTLFLSLLLFPAAASPLVPWVCVAALPYPVWSVWYQKAVAGKWCALCLGVQGVLILQGCLAVTQLAVSGIHPVGLMDPAVFLGASLLAGLLVHCSSGLIMEVLERRRLRSDFATFKYNDDVVASLFGKQPQAEGSGSSVAFGPEDARFNITVFSNPYCPPCSRIHPKLEELHRAGCRITYYLSSFNSELMRTTERLISYCQTHDGEDAWRMLDAWYSGNKSDSFFDGYDVEITDEARAESLRHKEWAERNNMRGTPTILLDGRELPRHYSIDDILFMIRNS